MYYIIDSFIPQPKLLWIQSRQMSNEPPCNHQHIQQLIWHMLFEIPTQLASFFHHNKKSSSRGSKSQSSQIHGKSQQIACTLAHHYPLSPSVFTTNTRMSATQQNLQESELLFHFHEKNTFSNPFHFSKVRGEVFSSRSNEVLVTHKLNQQESWTTMTKDSTWGQKSEKCTPVVF